ncbi:MAG: SAM-dependent methyltransferase [Betaproteobacteria bacterium]
MTDFLIRDVSDTAYWIAHHRAVESERGDALFRDAFAARLAGERGARIATAMPAVRMTSWMVVMRTRIIDDFILSAVREGVDTVVNLGAGLDTRPYRMELPAALQWIEADYARIIEYKEGHLAGESPRCRLERAKIDLADRTARREFLTGIDARAGKVLVLTEGVVPYLSNEDAALLADDLRTMGSIRFWIVDYFSNRAMKFRQRHQMGRRMQNAPFLFEPDDWFRFFKQHGWQPKTTRYLYDEGERLGRLPPLPLMARVIYLGLAPFLSRERTLEMRRFAGYVLLEPVP